MKKGSSCRCNYYRLSSLVVMSFVIVLIYWSMFSSSSVSGQSHAVDSKRNFNFNQDQNVVRFKPKLETNDQAVIPDRKYPFKNRGTFVQENDQLLDISVGDKARKSPEIGNQRGANNVNFDHRHKSNQKYVKNLDNNGGGDDFIPFKLKQLPDEAQQLLPIAQQATTSPKQHDIDQQLEETDRLQAIRTATQQPSRHRFQPEQISNSFKQIKATSNSQQFGESTVSKVRNSPSTDSQNDKWIVLTTIQLPTDDVKFLANLEGWKVVVVGDTKTPDSWSNPNCEYLSVEKQKTLGFEIVPLLPTKSYARKNVGYLYAISKGARIIYETDDDNRPTDLLKHFVYDSKTTGLKFVGGKIFNPYRHFGQPTLWPRGYPLGFIGANVTDNYHLGLFKTPSIQQGVVNGDPDMDAIFRLTRKRTEEMLNVSFDAQAPPAILPAGVLAPFNSQNTLFLQDMLWALLIPTTVTFRVCDIWRGYWAQRLMWEIDANLGFFAPNAFQKRNSHSYVVDAKDEDDLYFKTHEFYEFLLSWTCDSTLSFFDCAIKLSEDMFKNDFWGEKDFRLTKAWFNDIKNIGYREPKRVPFTLLNPVQPTSTFIRSDDSGQSEITKLTFTAGEMFPPMYYDSKYIVSSYWNRVQRAVQFCDGSSYQMSRKSLEQPTNPDVVLVVVFKDSNYFTIPHLNMLYGSKFPHIAYCGADFKRFEQISQNFKEPVTFIEADVQNGYFSYRCLSAVMKMKYRVSGFMMIGSDTLLNPWVIDRISQRDRIWFDHSDLMTAVSQTTPVIQSWPAWTSDLGKKAFKKAWLHLAQESLSNPIISTYFEKQFQKNLIANTKMPDLGLFVGPSDVVYIPSNFTDAFIMYIDIFSKYNVLHEIVVPTVISGLDLIKNMVPLNGRYMWTQQDKAKYEQQFNKDSAFLHPVQIGDAINTQRGRNFFCNTYLPFVLEKTKSQHRLVDLRNL